MRRLLAAIAHAFKCAIERAITHTTADVALALEYIIRHTRWHCPPVLLQAAQYAYCLPRQGDNMRRLVCLCLQGVFYAFGWYG